jgi:3-oxoacyl-[acyl-carrier-protein] synthase II
VSGRRRVVVTGLGCLTPLGADAASTWRSAVAGRSGVRLVEGFDTSRFPVRFAAQAPREFDYGDVPIKEARRLDRVVLLALGAALEALRDAGLHPLDGVDGDRVGVAVGSGIGGIETTIEQVRVLDRQGPRRVSPFAIPMAIANMPSGYVSIRHGLRGPNLCHVSACATGSHSLGEAARAIERGSADVMVAGGAEACVNEFGLVGFAAMRALSTRNDEPERASRPFDRGRDGFVIGEGSAVLILEERQHALARGARIRAELRGYGATADAAYIATPDDDGRGAARCMRLALEDAGVAPQAVDYLNAHATSTPAGDPIEAKAIRDVFGAHVERLAVSATKSMTGHLLGAAGALEALLCVRALEEGLLPPTINLDEPDPACQLDHVAHKARPATVRYALSNSFGFGGTNAALLLAHPDADA